VASQADIHPSAVIEPGAELGSGVTIGPFCHVGAHVALGDGVVLGSHVSITSATKVGAGTRVAAHAVLGGLPGDTKHKGSLTRLTIGSNCDIREFVTMHAGSDQSTGETIVGDNGLFLATAHVGHDCRVGNNVTLVNGATLGGHCEIADGVSIGGLTAVHQFVRIGRRAFLGGCAAVVGDVIPFGIVEGNKAKLRGLNVVGLKRSGMPRSELLALRAAYKTIFATDGVLQDNLAVARQKFAHVPVALEIIDFLSARGRRHFVVPPTRRSGDDDGDDLL